MAQITPEEFKGYYEKVLHPLHILVRFANASTSKMSVTISVKGIIISGELVSLREFHDGMTDLMFNSLEESGNKDEDTKSIRDIVQQMNVYEDKEYQDLVNSYVCIKDPLYIMGGGSRLKSPKQFWVGKIESVDGFMVGTMQQQTGPNQETE